MLRGQLTEHGNEVRRRMLEYIGQYISEHGYAPSNKEIADEIKIAPSCLWKHMKILLAQGDIETDLEDNWHTSRAYRLRR